MIGAEYYEDKGIKAGERDWASCSQEYAFNEDGSRADILDPATGNYKCFNQWQGSVRVYTGTNAGEWVPDSSVTTGVVGWRKIGCNSGLSGCTVTTSQYQARTYKSSKNDEVTIVNPVKKYSAYASGNYQLPFGEDLEVKTDLIYNRRESEFTSYRQIFNSAVTTSWLTSPTASYNPFGGYAAPVALFPFNSEQKVDTYRANISIGGGFGNALPSFASDWEWEVYAQYGKSKGVYGQDVIKSTEFSQAIQGCPTGSGTGCVAFNWLDPVGVATGVWSDEQIAYFYAHDVGNTTYEQKIIDASMNGTLYELPAGPLKFAAGLSFREESIDDIPGAVTLAGNLWGSTGSGRTKGTDNVKEAYAELDIPIISKIPLIEKLSLEISGRQSDYKSYGTNGVYKANLNWQITPEFRLTASQGTNFRAPALYELFLAGQTGYLSQSSVDPCYLWGDAVDNVQIRAACAAIGLAETYSASGYSSATIITQGSEGTLKAETADNWDIGLTWTPTFADLRIRVDYWDIKMHDTITKLNAYYIPYLCYTGRTELCSKFTRDTDPTSGTFGMITSITTGYVNIEELRGRGIDLEADYRKELSFGKLTVNASATWNLESSEDFMGSSTDYAGLVTSPTFVADATIRFDRGDWTYTWGMDFIGKGSDYDYNELYNYYARRDYYYSSYSKSYVYVKAHTEPTLYHSASVRYKADNWSIVGGVKNMFNEAPPAVSMTQLYGDYTRLGNTVAGQGYDMYGRTFYITFDKDF